LRACPQGYRLGTKQEALLSHFTGVQNKLLKKIISPHPQLLY
jgi:hypothetical protein